MSFKLKIIIIVVMISLLIYVFRKIKHSHFSTKYALIWVVADILVIVATLLVEKLVSFVKIFGIETVANLMFFIGFIFLLVVSFNLSYQVSILNKKIISLTQTIGINNNENK